MLGWLGRKKRSGWRAAPLFHDLSDDELDALAPLVKDRTARAGEVIAREGEAARELFVVESGKLEIRKRDGDDERLLDTVGPGEVAGEIALFDELPRFASMKAVEASKLHALAVRDLRPPEEGRDRRPKDLRRAYQRVLENLAEVLADRVRAHADASLAHARHREAVGTFLVHVLVLVCLYSFLLSGLALEGAPANTTLVSIPLQLLFAVGSWRIIRRSGYPLTEFGLGLRDMVGSVIEAAILTPLVIALVTGIKWVLVLAHGDWRVVPLVEHPDVRAHLAEPSVARMFAIYALTCAVQELIVRSALQSSLERFLTGPRQVLQAVLISALLFAMMHLHMSFMFALLAFVPGLFWGWLYARRRHLLGVTLSHVAVGGYVFFVLGVRL